MCDVCVCVCVCVCEREREGGITNISSQLSKPHFFIIFIVALMMISDMHGTICFS